MGSLDAYSTFGGNVRLLKYRYNLNIKNINEKW